MRSYLPLATLAAFVLAACSTINTSYDQDADVDFTRFRTFAWITNEPLIRPVAGEAPGQDVYISPIDDKRIRSAVEHELTKKGYVQAASIDQADLILSFSIGSQQKIRTYSVPGHYGYGYGYGGWYGGSDVRVKQITEGTLALQLFSLETKEAVWVGWASKRLSTSDDPDELIREAVEKILEPFPAQGAAAE